PEDLKAAAEVYRRAAPAAQYLYFEATHPARRQRELRRAQSIPAYHAYALASQGEYRAAVEALEAGRARQLAEALRSTQVQERFQDDPDLQRAWRTLQDALSRYHHADEERRPQAEEEMARARRDYYDQVRRAFPEFFQAPAFEDIAQAAAKAPLAYLLATPAGGLALIVRPEGVTPVPLDGLTEETLNRWLVWTDEAGENVVGGYLPAQLALSQWMPEALARLLPELGEKVMGPLADVLRTLTPTPAASGDFPLPLSRKAGEGEGGRGEGVRAVTLIPTGRLALLPLHAARYRRDGQEVCFLDEFTVAYVPSATALLEAGRRRKAAPPGPPRLVGVGNPLPPAESLADLHRQLQEAVAALPDDPAIAPWRANLQQLVARPTAELRHEGFLLRHLVLRLPERLGEPVQRLLDLSRQWPLSLRYARAELQSIVDLLPPDAALPFYEEAATRAALLPHLADATHLHFSCHGTFDPNQPLESALLLAGDDRLTLQDMLTPGFAALDRARLVVLSACQTAITDFRDLPEETIGLPAGLLQAGAPAVIGTLWPVDDASTALLMTRAYELMLQEGEPPAEALRRAQRWLRDLTNAELEAYLEGHRAIAEARRQAAQRMPLSLIAELLIQVTTTEDPKARPYADPYFWAPFTFSGIM
ncbi:MAG: CHAT domain-containing protein, partial [Anaerolineae bacterium]